MLRLLHFQNIFVIKLYLVSVLNKSCTCNNRPVVRTVINTNGIAVILSIILKRNRLTQKLVRTFEPFTIFCLLAILKDNKINRSCLCVCCATMTPLFNVTYVILQRSLYLKDLSVSMFMLCQ